MVLFNVFQTICSREAFSLGLRCDELSEVAQESAPGFRAGQAPAAPPAPATNPAPVRA